MKHDYLDKYSHLDSLLHRLDPRVKILGFLLMIVLMLSEPRGELMPFLFYYFFLGLLVLVSKVPLRFLLFRCLMVSPFIMLAALVLPLSYWTGGTPVPGGGAELWLYPSVSIILKAYASVMILVLLTSTDRFHRILKGMRMMGMPSYLGVMAALMYRYVFIINDERLRTNRARESRTPGRLSGSRFKVYGQQAALVFLRSWDRARTVYQSMVSRGFSGNFPEYKALRFHRRDALFFAAALLVLISVRILV